MLSEMLSIGGTLESFSLVESKLLGGPVEGRGGEGRGGRGGEGKGLNQGACSSGKNDIFKASEEHFPWGFFLKRIWTNVVDDVFAYAREYMH